MRKSRLSLSKQDRLIEHFVAADLVGVNCNTAAYYFHRLRELIARSLDELDQFAGEIEVDESYFGGHHKGKRGRGAVGKIPVFGILKRKSKVFTKKIPDAKVSTLMPIIPKK